MYPRTSSGQVSGADIFIMKNLSFSSPGLHKILISKQFTFRLPSLFLIREKEHHCRFEACVLENFQLAQFLVAT